MGILYIVSTPIGNLKDISMRAIDILGSVDLILCEDTRVASILLRHYQIKTPTLSYHQHSKLKKAEYIIQLLKEGKNLALISDAGTPGISDPGNKLINSAIKQLNNLTVVPIPGPSALVSAVAISGFAMDRFLFLGFPPVKNKRKKFFKEVADSKYPVVLYESTHRIVKTLKDLEIINKELKIVLCRELTKKFETIYRGTIEEVLKQLETGKTLGEFVIVIEGK